MRFFVFITTILLLIFTNCNQADARQDSSSQIIFEIGHFEERFLSSQLLIQDLVAQLTQDDQQRPIVHVIENAFDIHQMKEWATESFNRNQSTIHQQAVINFADSTNFSAFLQLFYAANLELDNEELQNDFERYLQETEQTEEGLNRFLLIREFLDQTRIIPITVQMLEDVLSTVVFGLNVSLDEETRLTDRQVNELIITLRSNFRELFNNVLPLTTLYSTREFSLQELQFFMDFLKSESGRWFIRTGNTATLDSFGEFARVASEHIASWNLDQSEQIDN